MDQTAENVKWHLIGFFLFIVAIAVAAWTSCASNLATGYSVLLHARNAGDTAAKILAEVGTAKRNECLKDKSTYKECIAATKAAAELWTKTIKPAYNTALEATWGILETARKAKEKDAKWLETIKPGLCAFLKALDQWKAYLGETKAKEILDALGVVEGLLCQ